MSGGIDLLQRAGGIPLSDRAAVAVYLKAINGKAKRYTASPERVEKIAAKATADLAQIGRNPEGAEVEHRTAGPRYDRQKSMWGTQIFLRFEAGEWRLTRAVKTPVWGWLKAKTEITPAGRIH